jgi:hypothetical protein
MQISHLPVFSQCIVHMRSHADTQTTCTCTTAHTCAHTHTYTHTDNITHAPQQTHALTRRHTDNTTHAPQQTHALTRRHTDSITHAPQQTHVLTCRYTDNATHTCTTAQRQTGTCIIVKTRRAKERSSGRAARFKKRFVGETTMQTRPAAP